MSDPLPPRDPAHYPDLASEEEDRMRDEHDERVAAQDRYDECGPTPLSESEFFAALQAAYRFDPAIKED